ncbi:hypothetical protein BB558_003416 [Smittium angustum]|uniref:RING-type domain-containing protein n=1 Tax=Smittium angustum TaxID=133377 RepID=A0A2U1J617_SMIAN|nr:hypothetical protein BB558_003416 [Smittium angustum]
MNILYFIFSLSFVYSFPVLYSFNYDTLFGLKDIKESLHRNTENVGITNTFNKRNVEAPGVVFEIFMFAIFSAGFIIVLFIIFFRNRTSSTISSVVTNTNQTAINLTGYSTKNKGAIPKEDLESYPILTMNEYMKSINSKAFENSIVEKIDCIICFEEFKNDDLIRIIPCRHPFHKQC